MEGDLRAEVQGVEGGFHFPTMLEGTENVHLKMVALRQRGEGLEELDDAAVDVQVAEHEQPGASRGRERMDGPGVRGGQKRTEDAGATRGPRECP